MENDIERIRDEALLDKPKRTSEVEAQERIAPFDDHAAYDETAARVGNKRNVLVGDDPGAAAADDDARSS